MSTSLVQSHANEQVNPVAASNQPQPNNGDPQLGLNALLGDSAILRFSPYLLPLDIEPKKNIAYDIDIIDAVLLMVHYFGSPLDKETGHNFTDLLNICFRAAQRDGRLNIDKNGVAHFDQSESVRKEMINEMLIENI